MKKYILASILLIGTTVFSQVQAPVQQKVKIELTLQEVETILGALGKLPYDQSAGLIQNIYAQANRQLQPDTAKVKGIPQKN